MRALTFVTFVALVPLFTGCATVYHVSPAGSDAAEGTAPKPFRTIQKAASVMLPGETCVIHAGTYREQIRPANSGEPGKPIRLVAAEGENVLVTGTEAIGRWTVHKGKIWKATADWPIDQVFVDRKIMVQARFPNADRNHWKVNSIVFQPGDHALLNEKLDQEKDYWKGAVVWGLSERLGWVASIATITGSEKGKLMLSGKRMPWYGGGSGRGYLRGLIGLLDAEREWHQEGDTLYFIPPDGADPNKLLIEATQRRYSFDLSGLKHIEVAGLHTFAAGVNMDKAEHCAVNNCRMRWTSFERKIWGGFNRDRGINPKAQGLGIVLGGKHNTVRDSVIAYCTGDGISIYGENNTVENCVIHDCNTSASDCAPITCTGVGHVVRGNTLFNGGRSILVHRHLKKGRIEHNHMFNAGLLSNDLGMTYTYQTDGQGTVIAYNLVYKNLGRAPGNVGIYLDDMTRNHVVHHNLVYGCNEAMAMNPPGSKGNLILNNTLDGGAVSLGMSRSRPQDMTGTRFIDNIFLNRLPSNLPNAEVGTNVFHTVDAGLEDRSARNYLPAADSPAIDAGIEVPPYTDGYAGKAPDMGAFERGAKKPWRAGSTLPQTEWDMDPDWLVLPGHQGPCYSKGK